MSSTKIALVALLVGLALAPAVPSASAQSVAECTPAYIGLAPTIARVCADVNLYGVCAEVYQRGDETEPEFADCVGPRSAPAGADAHSILGLP